MKNISISEEKFIDRLESWMKCEGLNPNKLTTAASLSIGLIGKALKNRTSMNSDSIERILCAYTDLNADWLMTGRGTMYVDKSSDDINTASTSLKNDNLTDFLRDRNQELELEVRRLLEENASLKTRLELLDNSKGKTG